MFDSVSAPLFASPMLVGKLECFATLEQGWEWRQAWRLPSMGSFAVCRTTGHSSSAKRFLLSIWVMPGL